MSLQEFKKDFGLLIEGGFIAVKQGNKDAALKLFRAAHIINPNHTAPTFGLGYVALNRMDLSAARKHFEEVLKKDSKNAEAKAYLGFCFILTKATLSTKRTKSTLSPEQLDELSSSGVALEKEVLKETKDDGIKRFAQAAIELAEQSSSFQETPFKTKAKQ